MANHLASDIIINISLQIYIYLFIFASQSYAHDSGSFGFHSFVKFSAKAVISFHQRLSSGLPRICHRSDTCTTPGQYRRWPAANLVTPSWNLYPQESPTHSGTNTPPWSPRKGIPIERLQTRLQSRLPNPGGRPHGRPTLRGEGWGK